MANIMTSCPDAKGAGQNRTDYGNDSVRVFVVLGRSAISLPGLSRGSLVGRCQMTTLPQNEQESRREAWEETIFELSVLAVLIATVWVILSL